MAYWEWGDSSNPDIVVCVHGLTRTGRDFDALASSLAERFRVICPDIAGRGRSDWLSNSSAYTVPQYVSDILTLIARLNTTKVHWVGTSMGGLIGLGLAGALTLAPKQQAVGNPQALAREAQIHLGRVVLNDIGPVLDLDGLGRIASYVGEDVQCATFEDAVNYVRTVSAGFGPHTDEQWQALTRHVFVQREGKWVRHYDKRIAQPMALYSPALIQATEAMLWQAYESIQSPVLVLRGQESDLLSAQTAQEMLERNTNASLVEFEGVGHAPSIMARDQIRVVQDFLLARP